MAISKNSTPSGINTILVLWRNGPNDILACEPCPNLQAALLRAEKLVHRLGAYEARVLQGDMVCKVRWGPEDEGGIFGTQEPA